MKPNCVLPEPDGASRYHNERRLNDGGVVAYCTQQGTDVSVPRRVLGQLATDIAVSLSRFLHLRIRDQQLYFPEDLCCLWEDRCIEQTKVVAEISTMNIARYIIINRIITCRSSCSIRTLVDRRRST